MFARKLWLRRLGMAAAVALALGYVPYHLYASSGLARMVKLRAERDTLHESNLKLYDENQRLRAELDALTDDDGSETLSLAAVARAAGDGLDERRTARADFELGAALLVATYVTLQLTGGLRSPVYPLVYALTAFVVTFHRKAIGLPLVAVTLGLEYLLYASGPRDARANELVASHAAFIGFFGVVHLIFLQAEVLRQRREHRQSVRDELRRLREEARDFRLISSQLAADPRTRSREADQERLAIGAVETIHATLFYTLQLLKKSLELPTCVLLWLDQTREKPRSKERATDPA